MSQQINAGDDLNFIDRAIRDAVKSRVQAVIDDEMVGLMERINQKVHQEVDKIALHVLAHYSVRRMGPEILITVKKDTPK